MREPAQHPYLLRPCGMLMRALRGFVYSVSRVSIHLDAKRLTVRWEPLRSERLVGKPEIEKLSQSPWANFPLAQAIHKCGYLAGAPGVLWKPPNSFRPSGIVTVPALATLRPSFAQ